MDEDGFLYILDRAKDMIISGGENVYSTEVENVLRDHPDVLENVVIGLPHPRWGEAVTTVITLCEGAGADEAALITHCRARLAGYNCPKAIVVRDALVKSGAGKILKPALRAELADLFQVVER